MSDVSQGPGWWLASDGKWYPPEQHPEVLAITSGSPLPLMSENPWGRPQSGNLGYAQPVPPALPGVAADVGARPRRMRPGAIVIGVALALVALVVGAPVAGHIEGHSPGRIQRCQPQTRSRFPRHHRRRYLGSQRILWAFRRTRYGVRRRTRQSQDQKWRLDLSMANIHRQAPPPRHFWLSPESPTELSSTYHANYSSRRVVPWPVLGTFRGRTFTLCPCRRRSGWSSCVRGSHDCERCWIWRMLLGKPVRRRSPGYIHE